MKRTFTLLNLLGIFMTLFLVQMKAQTTLVSPTGDGGFETGSTFTANGWTVVNGTQTNQWFVGPLGQNGGTNGAYISNDVAGATNSYLETIASTTHFYRDVTIPAGQTILTISFDVKGIGELFSGTVYDYVGVSVVPTTTVPVAGTTLPAANLVGFYWAKPTYTAATVGAAVTPGTTVRVVFTWRNDGSGTNGVTPAGGLDNIAIATRNPATFTSAATGNWSANTTWSGGNVPTSADNAVIADGHTVTIDVAGISCNNLTVGQGASGILTYAATPTSISVNGNMTVAPGGSFIGYNGTTGKSLNLIGNLTNNGSMDLSYVSSALFLAGTTTPQIISGTGNFTACNAVRQLSVLNPAGATLSMPMTISAFLILTNGVLNNGSNLTLNNVVTCGTATVPTVVVTQRSQLSSLTNALTVASGAVYNVSYLNSTLGALAPITEGPEIPTSRTLNTLAVSNLKGVTLIGDLTLTAAATALTLTTGPLNVPTANTIQCTNSAYLGPSATSVGYVSGGSLGLTLSATSNNRTFAIGSNGVTRGLTLTGVSSAGATTVKAAVSPTIGGTAGAGLSGLTATRRWIVTKTGADIISAAGTIGLAFGLDDAFGSVLAADRKVAQSATLTGTYDNIGPAANVSTTLLTSATTAVMPGLNLATLNAGTSYFALAATTTLPTTWDGGAATLNWADANNWSNNVVPTCAEDVFITQNANVNIAGTFAAKSVYIGLNSTFSMTNSAANLTVGSCTQPTGGNQSFTVDGTFNQTNGRIRVNGKMVIASATAIPAQFNMSGGSLTIDGNDGTAAGSIPTASDLLNFGTSANTLMSINATGGTINIVDPHYLAGTTSNRALSINISSSNLNTQTFAGNTIQFGDGASTQVGTGTGGFVFDTYVSSRNVRLGNVIVNGGSDPLSFVSGPGTTADASDIGGNLTVNAGSELRSGASKGIGVVGNIINNGTISITSGALIIGGYNTSTIGTTTPTTSPTISGSGVWRNNIVTTSATASINSITTDINGTVTLTGPLSISSTLTMTNGNINTTNGLLTLGTGVLPAAGTLATGIVTRIGGMIVGPIARVMPNATFLQSDQRALFPVGDGTNYAPFYLNYTTAPAAIGTVQAEFTPTNPGTSGLPLNAYGGINVTTSSPSGYWNVTSTTADGQYTATGDATNFKKSVGSSLITDFANIRLIKRAKSSPFVAEGTPSAPTTMSAVPLTLLATYGEFAIGGTDLAIPVELVYFKGNTEGSSNRLVWATATERNTSMFVVERSKNGVSNWTTVAEQKAAGNSSAALKYAALDANPLTISYYRLKTVDFDGKTQLSNVVTLIRESGKFGISAVFPVPTDKTATLEFEATQDQNIALTLTDMTGRVVLQQSITAQKGLNNYTIDASNLSSGIYILSLYNGQTKAISRFVKQ
jgi:hypothetical protein